MNAPVAWLQLALFCGALLLLTKPLGLYLGQVLERGRTWLDPVMGPVERAIYRLSGIEPDREQDWSAYTVSLLAFSLVGLGFTYLLLRGQGRLPLNPQHLPGLTPHLAFNTAVSFTTNTNWQSYGGEATLSYFSQMVALTLHNFTSAAAGIAVAAALVRGIARHSARTIGNFWADLVRVTCYVLVPLALALALFLVAQGMIQNFQPYVTARPLAGGSTEPQVIAQGPMASQVAI
ncbi:MAG TPA: potassium-transporting ATPase subunit KdpA, partial [Opitutaceae bacterium]|nr:potassium-transporting ATPase subunit KdpA [Opitutaceae bacterium]